MKYWVLVEEKRSFLTQVDTWSENQATQVALDRQDEMNWVTDTIEATIIDEPILRLVR